jgi:hypothetical protein
MKAQDLRIGNWVQFRHTETPVLITLADFVREYKDEHLEDYEPIPLTEEWLERFNWNAPKDIGVSFSLTTGEIHFVIGNYYKKIQYVHQLQNLYFALTNTELELND